MNFKKAILFLLLSFLAFSNASGQEDEFCDAVTAIMRDAPNRFRDIKGKMTHSDRAYLIWESEIKVPGTISSRFVNSMGVFYEGAVFQSKTIDGLQTAYNKYTEMLSKCLTPLGYSQSRSPNFNTGLEDLKKVAFLAEMKENSQPNNVPPHVALEATYNKQIGYYTIVFYIFEH